MPRVLCLHPQAEGLEQLRRVLLEHRRSWDVDLALDLETARERLAANAVDAVVTVVTPDFDGMGFLCEVRDHRNETIRVVMGRELDDAQVRSLKVAHRVLPLDGPPELLIESLGRALTMRELVQQPALRELLGRVGHLPVAPRVYAQLSRRLEDPSTSVEQLARLVGEDPGLSTQVLRIANSSYFGRDQGVMSLDLAAARLGTRLLRSIVLAAEVFARFPVPPTSLSLDELQRHSSLVARIASGLDPRASWKEDAFTAGILHDVGKLVIASRLPEMWQDILSTARTSQRKVHEVEQEILGVDHGTLGACLLGMWGLPSVVLEAVHRHHRVSLLGDLELDSTVAVALADQLAHDLARQGPPPATAADPGVISHADPRWPWWREMAEQLAGEASGV
jgi:HD-like signal output (HDOD) protein